MTPAFSQQPCPPAQAPGAALWRVRGLEADRNFKGPFYTLDHVRYRLKRGHRGSPERAGVVGGVSSLSGDLHKYGYASKGASTLYHRSPEQRSFQIFASDAWPAGAMSTPTIAGTRPGGAIASAWAVLEYLGESGYRRLARQVCEAREALTEGIQAIDGLETYGDPNLSIMLFGGAEVDPYALYGRMLRRGWFSGLVTEPRAIHLMLAPSHAEVAPAYLSDLAECVREVTSAAGPGETRRVRYN